MSGWRPLLLTALLLAGCVDATEQTRFEAQSATNTDPWLFSYTDTRGRSVDAQALRGRVTVLLFGASFDLASQAMATRIGQLFRTHTPRFNALAVLIETPNHLGLVQAFADTLLLPYPVALGEPEVVKQHDRWGSVRTVPTLVVLDAEGRERFRTNGVLELEQLEAALSRAR